MKLNNGNIQVDGITVRYKHFFSLSIDSRVFSKLVRLCFWNINGVKNKFNSVDVNNIIQDNDILAISETHFNIRSKCPSGFFLIGRSTPIKSKKPR